MKLLPRRECGHGRRRAAGGRHAHERGCETWSKHDHAVRVPGAAHSRDGWSQYLGDGREATAKVAERLLQSVEPEERPEVMLTDFDPEGELKVVANIPAKEAMYPPTVDYTKEPL